MSIQPICTRRRHPLNRSNTRIWIHCRIWYPVPSHSICGGRASPSVIRPDEWRRERGTNHYDTIEQLFVVIGSIIGKHLTMLIKQFYRTRFRDLHRTQSAPKEKTRRQKSWNRRYRFIRRQTQKEGRKFKETPLHLIDGNLKGTVHSLVWDWIQWIHSHSWIAVIAKIAAKHPPAQHPREESRVVVYYVNGQEKWNA